MPDILPCCSTAYARFRWSIGIACSFALLAAQAHALTAQAEPYALQPVQAAQGLLQLPTAALPLNAGAHVQLRRAQEPKLHMSLTVVTKGSAASLAVRYGVTPQAVKPLPKSSGDDAPTFLVRLPARRPAARPPVRPASIIARTVLPGETLDSIAAKFGLEMLDLLSVNLERTSLTLKPGEVIRIPTAVRGLLVPIKPGQTALSLIHDYQADLTHTARANDVLPTSLEVGDMLLLPGIRAHGFCKQLIGTPAPRQPSSYLSKAALVRAAGASLQQRLAWPIQGARITSRYAARDIPYHRQVFHGGVDLAAPVGTPIRAAASGLVTESGYGTYGMNVYTIQGNSTLIYGHLSRVAVRTGKWVNRGDLLGFVGCTGICTGAHLHFEFRWGGQTIDPLLLLP